MSRFVALYRVPTDPAAAETFEAAYRSTHLPLVAQTPGLTSIEVSRVRRTLAGEPQLLMAVLTFADPAAYRAAMASPEWAAAGANLAEIGGVGLATMLTLEDPEILDPAGTT